MDPETLRAAIPACDECAYLNTGASGPAPRRVVEAVCETQRRHEFDACAVDHYERAADVEAAARDAVAAHLGCRPDDVALVASTGDGISRVANAIDWRPGDVVVRTDLEHPSGVLPWRRLREDGVEVRTVACPDGRLPIDDYREALEGARLACLSSESWLHGTRLPVAEAVAEAHDAGALVVVDAVQTVGQHPVDVRAWEADAVCASGHKWLLGPWGAGFLYVSPDSREAFRPRHVGYRSAADPTGDEPTGDGLTGDDATGGDATGNDPTAFGYHPGARRFEVSTTAVAPFAGLTEGLEILEEIGLHTVEAHVERLTDRLKEGLGGRLRSPRPYESGLVAFEVGDADSFVERAAAAGVAVRSVPVGWVRASVHVFNTEEDVDSLLELL